MSNQQYSQSLEFVAGTEPGSKPGESGSSTKGKQAKRKQRTIADFTREKGFAWPNLRDYNPGCKF